MNRLLATDFERARKNIIFLFGEIVMFMYGIYVPVSLHTDNIKYLHDASYDKGFCAYVIPVGILMAFFCCIYCGEEYEGRTVQNKIIVGHSRKSIYSAQWLSCIMVGSIMCLSYFIPSLFIGRILLGSQSRSLSELLMYFISAMLCVFACVSLYCMLITTIQKRIAGTALTLFVLLVIIYFGIIVWQDLHLPANTMQFHVVDGVMTKSYGANPRYPQGGFRIFLEYLFDFLPSGQAWQFNTMTAEKLPRMIASSLILLFITFISGITIFEKRDLK